MIFDWASSGPTALELALLEALKAALGNNVYAVETWEGSVADAFLAGRPIRLPAVLVSYQGGPFEPMGGDHYVQHAEVHTLILGRNLRDEAAARRPDGATDEVGTYALLQTVAGTLTGADLDLEGVGELVLLSMEPLEVGKGRDALGSAWLCRFAVELDFSRVPPEDALEEVDATYTAPKPEAEDDLDLVTDTIVLETE